MNAKNNLEKSANVLTPEQKAVLAKYLKAGLGAGVLASGVGLAVSRAKANEERASRKPEESKNAIIVDIRKDNFLKDIPTPEDQKNMVSGTKLLAQPSATEGQQSMTPEEIAAIKKDVLRRNERKFNFFGKSAKDTSIKEDNKEVSSEKTAGFWDTITNFAFRPVDTTKDLGKRFFNGATTGPLSLAAGGVTAVYLSALIVDKINKMRADASKQKAKSARNEYVKLLQGSDESEKYAFDLASSTGALVGGSFIIPAVLSAVITNKIMERRNEKDKKAKSMTNSFPEEPLILYKTSEAKEIPIKPETAFVAMMLKMAMFETIESMEKVAQVNDTSKDDALYAPYVNNIIGTLGDKSNTDLVLNLADSYKNKNKDDIHANLMSLAGRTIIGMGRDFYDDLNNRRWEEAMNKSKDFFNIFRLDKNELIRRVSGDRRAYDAIVGQMNSEAGTKWLENTTNQYLTDNLVKNRILRKDSPILRIMQWIMNNMGVGKLIARNEVYNKLQAMSAPQKV